MTLKESRTIDVARFIFIIGVLFIHFPLRGTAIEGESISSVATPFYDFISAHFFLRDSCLIALFFLSGWLYFYGVPDSDAFCRGGVNSCYVKKIRKRVASLVVPYFFWNVFWLCYTILKNNYLSSLGISPEITIDSLGKIIQVFFYRGEGANPTFPIAGYMWFMRDLFICAVLTPLYLWIYRRKNALLIVTIIVAMYLLGIWSWPLNIGFILGGYLGYRRISVIDWVIKQKWWVIIMAFLIISVPLKSGTSY